MPAQEWARHAACKPQHSGLFFADPKQEDCIRAAKNICWTECPVRAECLAQALEIETPSTAFGVYGGMSARERTLFIRNEKRKQKKVAHAVSGNTKRT